MATIISGSNTLAIVSLAAGESLYAGHMIPDGISDLAVAAKTSGGSTRFTAKVDLALTVERLHLANCNCKHIRFARADRKAVGPCFAQPNTWPRMRVALRYANVPVVRALGGFGNALVYGDEIAVPDYATSGSSGWIIPRKDIRGYLDGLPPIPRETGELDPSKPVATFFVVWNGDPPRCFFRVCATREEAERMIWKDTSYRNPRTRAPVVEERQVGLSKAGNPVIFVPTQPAYSDPEGKKGPVANVPFETKDFPRGSSQIVPTGKPLEMGGKTDDGSSEYWGLARRALLKYYEKFAPKAA